MKGNSKLSIVASSKLPVAETLLVGTSTTKGVTLKANCFGPLQHQGESDFEAEFLEIEGMLVSECCAKCCKTRFTRSHTRPNKRTISSTT